MAAVEHDLRHDEAAAGVLAEQPRTPSIRWCQLIALGWCLAGIAIALKWPDSWGLTVAFGGYFVAVVLEWIHSAGSASNR